MVESLYISPDLFDNHGLSETSFEGLAGPRQDRFDDTTLHNNEGTSTILWKSMMNRRSVNLLESNSCNALLNLNSFSHIKRWIEYNLLLYTKSNQFK